MSRSKSFRGISANCYDVNSMYPPFTRKMPDITARPVTMSLVTFHFYGWICIFDSKKPPHTHCNDDGIHFTVFYYVGELRVFFWPLRGESER